MANEQDEPGDGPDHLPVTAVDLLRRELDDLNIGKKDPSYFGSDRAIAIMADAYVNDKVEWLKIATYLRSFKGVIREIKPSIMAEVRRIQSETQIIPDSANDITVKEALAQLRRTSDIPVVDCDSCLMPDGYKINFNGAVHKDMIKGDEIVSAEVSSTPVFVNRLFMRRGTESHEVELVWLRGKRWKRRVIKRSQMSIGRHLAEVSEFGLPVINAGLLAEYLVRFEQTNLSRLRSAYTTAQLGWIADGTDPVGLGFQAGETYLRAPNHQGPDVAASAELNTIARKVKAKGTLDGWSAALEPMKDYRSVRLAIYAALVSPLLRIFDWKNACLEWASTTSEGKSTVIQFLMSVWQSPHDDIPNWNNTGVALERTAAAMNDTYLAIDDTATAGPQNDYRNTVQSAIYMLVAGVSKGRGKADGGVQDLLSWRLFFVTTGEVPTGELGNAEGAAARILSITDKPLGDVNDETGARITKGLEAMHEHHGSAGPAFVQWLMANRDFWPRISEAYKRAYTGVSAIAKSGVGNRAAHVIALLEATAVAAHEALPLPWDIDTSGGRVSLFADREMCTLLAGAIQQTKDSSTKNASVYELLMGFVVSNPDRFWRDNDHRLKHTPNGGWVGRMSVSSSTIDFHTVEFKALCTKWKIGERVALRALLAQGKLEIREGSGRNSIQERVEDERFWFYKVVGPSFVEDEAAPPHMDTGTETANDIPF